MFSVQVYALYLFKWTSRFNSLDNHVEQAVEILQTEDLELKASFSSDSVHYFALKISTQPEDAIAYDKNSGKIDIGALNKTQGNFKNNRTLGE